MIDPATGQLRLQGWATGIEDNIVVNHRDGRPVSQAHEALNRLRYRVWNYHLLYTEKHVIQFNFVDVVSANGRGVCPSNIVIFDKSNPRDTMRKVEEKTFRCPQFDREKAFDFETPSYHEGNGGDLLMSVTKGNGHRDYIVKLKSKEIDLDLEMTFNYDNGAPAIFYATPLTPERTSFFSSLKKSNLQLSGHYTYEGKKHTCSDCLMMIDDGRGHTVYGIQYYWVMFMGRLADGRAVTGSMSDGMAARYDGLD